MEPAPQAVVDHLTDLGGRIWSLALEQANGRLEVERENLAAVRSQIEAEKVEAAELADHLTAELDSMKNHVAALEKAEKDARNEVECLTGQVTSLSERAAVSEAHQSDLEKHVSDLNDELARVNQQNSELIKALAESIS